MNLVTIYRAAHYFQKNKIGLISKFLEIIIFIIYNSRVPASAKIGKSTKFAYSGIGCVLHKDTTIGNNCIIGQGITIGGRAPKVGVPKIGNNVYLGPGCRILGPVTIGDNVVIGANSVVVSDIPTGSVSVGIPSRIVRSGVKDISTYL